MQQTLSCALSAWVALAGCGAGGDGGRASVEDTGVEDTGVEDTGNDAAEDAAHDAALDSATPDGGGALDPHARPLDERLAPMVACLEAFVAADNDTSGAAVAVLEGGEVAWARGFGTVAVDDDRPVRETTLFRFGSVLKMMTSAALLTFVDDGALTTETPITDVLPALAFANADAAQLTPHRLMTHQGGFEDVLEIDGPRDDAGLGAFVLGESFGEVRFLAPPGRFFNYSNPNFYVAGLLVETLDGAQTYRDVMRSRVFAPLGMDRTFFRSEDVLADGDFAFGQVLDRFGQRQRVAPDTYDNAWARPAGYGWASVLDLAKFARFVMRGDAAVLTEASWRAMRSPQVDTREFLDLAAYGYGLSVSAGFFLGETFYDAELLSHSGAIPGYGAHMYVVPGGDFAVVLVVNSLLASPGECIARGLLAEMERWPEAPAPDLTVDPSSFAALEGSFGDVTGRVGAFRLRVRGGQVELVAPELDRVGYAYERALEPISPDNFVWNTSQGPIVLTAIREDDGRVDYIRSRIFVGAREAADGKPRPVAPQGRLGALEAPEALRRPTRPGFYRRGGW